MFANIRTSAMTVELGGANRVGAWVADLPKDVRQTLSGILLSYSKKMAGALHYNGGGKEGTGKYWINRTGKLAQAINPENAFVKDTGRSIEGNVTCDSAVYEEYGKLVLHRARKTKSILFRDPVGKSPVEMVVSEFKPSLVMETDMVLKNKIDGNMRGLLA